VTAGGRVSVVAPFGGGLSPLIRELYRGFDGEPTGEADLFRVETLTYW
jgi:hypothetical protein